jgi:hypothetical protein
MTNQWKLDPLAYQYHKFETGEDLWYKQLVAITGRTFHGLAIRDELIAR